MNFFSFSVFVLFSSFLNPSAWSSECPVLSGKFYCEHDESIITFQTEKLSQDSAIYWVNGTEYKADGKTITPEPWNSSIQNLKSQFYCGAETFLERTTFYQLNDQGTLDYQMMIGTWALRENGDLFHHQDIYFRTADGAEIEGGSSFVCKRVQTTKL